MESAEGAAARNLHGLQTVAHFFGGFVGKGDGQDVVRPDALFDEMGDAVGDDTGLAAAGTGQDEHRPVAVSDGPALRFGQSG